MPDTDAEFLAAMLARTRALRLKRGLNQKQMAQALGVPYDNYRQYEKRSPLPHHLIPRFAAVVDEDISVVLTGRKSPPPRPAPAPTNQGAPEDAKRGRRA